MKVTEKKVKGGVDLTIKCDRGYDIERTTKDGMFCNRKNCECEKEAKAATKELRGFMDAMGDFDKLFGIAPKNDE